MPQKHRYSEQYPSFLAAAVSVISFLVYLPCIRNEFLLWDDANYVTHNPFIRSFNYVLIKSAFFEFHASNWHPLTWLSHALDFAMWGVNPAGHHFTNIVLHAANTALVVLVTIRLIELYKERIPEGSTSWQEENTLIAGGVTGLLFGLHPVHVESVAWVAERKDLLCALFFLMAILSYLKFLSLTNRNAVFGGTNGGPARRSFLLCLGFFALSLLSKPMAVSLPFVLLIIDWYPAKKIETLDSFKSGVIEKIPFFLMSLGSAVLTILAQREGEAMGIMKSVPLQSRILVALHSLAVYSSKIFFPVKLFPFYPYPSATSLSSLAYLTPVALVIGFSIFCIFTARTNGFLPAVWCYFVVTLLPVLGIVQVGLQSMADRYTYLPSVGLLLMTGIQATRLSGGAASPGIGTSSAKLPAVIIAAAVLITLGYLTVGQTRLWKNDFTLWSYAIEENPDKAATVYFNRGIAFRRIGKYDQAIEDYSEAIAVDATFSPAYVNRGFAYVQIGQIDEAAADFQRACDMGSRESCEALRLFSRWQVHQ